MVTIFVGPAGSFIKAVWNFLEKASLVDIRLVELEHPSLKMLSFCSRRVSIYAHPCFYRSLKLRYLLDIGGVFRDGRVMTELCTGSLRHTVDIFTPDDSRTIVDNE